MFSIYLSVAGGVSCPAEVSTKFFSREEHRYPSPLPFQGLGPSDVAVDPLDEALFAEDVNLRTHIPRAWAVDDDEDYADADVEVRPRGGLDVFIAAEARALGAVCCIDAASRYFAHPSCTAPALLLLQCFFYHSLPLIVCFAKLFQI